MKTITYIFLIALVAVVSALILRHTIINTPPTHQSSLDTVVTGATVWEYNELGKLTSTINAQKIKHFTSKQSATTLFIKPVVISYSNTGAVWHIHADQATTDKTGDTIWFQGHVIFHRLPTAQKSETTISTDKITVYSKKEIGMTNDAVKIERPGMIIEGTGLIAHFKTGHYELKSQPHVIYLPTVSTRAH